MFVYRSEAGQRLSDIREKLQTIFPHAILLDPTVTIEEHHRKAHCQCKYSAQYLIEYCSLQMFKCKWFNRYPMKRADLPIEIFRKLSFGKE